MEKLDINSYPLFWIWIYWILQQKLLKYYSLLNFKNEEIVSTAVLIHRDRFFFQRHVE